MIKLGRRLQQAPCDRRCGDVQTKRQTRPQGGDAKPRGPPGQPGYRTRERALLRRVFRMSARLLALVVVLTVIGPATNALAAIVHAPAAWAGEPQLEITGSAPDLSPGRAVTVDVLISNPSTSSAAVRVMGL